MPHAQLTRGFLGAPCKHGPTCMSAIVGGMTQLSTDQARAKHLRTLVRVLTGCAVWGPLLLTSHKKWGFEPLRRPPGAAGGECGRAWGLNLGRLIREPPRWETSGALAFLQVNTPGTPWREACGAVIEAFHGHLFFPFPLE